MNTKIVSLHVNGRQFSGTLWSQYFNAEITFDGYATWDFDEDEVSATEINFSETMPGTEINFLRDIIVSELCQNHATEIYTQTQEDEHDWHQQSLEDEKMGN